jgi:hypothetical protein
MSASIVAAITATQEKFGREDVETVFQVKILAFDWRKL